MTDSTIGVAEPGSPTKLLQAYQNTVSGQTVQAEGIVQVDSAGVPVPTGTASNPVQTNLAQWIGSAAPTVGQKTMANSLPVTLASDQGAVIVSQNLLGSNDKPDISVNQTNPLAIQNPSNLPKLSVDPQGSLQVNNNNLRAVEERIMMLVELAAVNSLIASDNGAGARNYQELR